MIVVTFKSNMQVKHALISGFRLGFVNYMHTHLGQTLFSTKSFYFESVNRSRLYALIRIFLETRTWHFL